MSAIEIEKCVYNVHPVFYLYAANTPGEVINIIKKVPNQGIKNHSGYMHCSIRKYGGRQKTCQVHQFVWECFNGVIPEGKVIDHINSDKEDNRLCNLQLVTQQQNCKKAVKDRDYTFAAKHHENKKCVKAINNDTNEVSYYNSMYAVQQHLGTNVCIVKMVCEGLNNCKSGISKKNGNSFKFEYVRKEDMPDDYMKSANKRPRKVPDEDKKKHRLEAMKKWQKKEFKCPKCGKTLKNGSKYVYSKKCE